MVSIPPRQQCSTLVDNFTFHLQHLLLVLPVSLNRINSKSCVCCRLGSDQIDTRACLTGSNMQNRNRIIQCNVCRQFSKQCSKNKKKDIIILEPVNQDTATRIIKQERRNTSPGSFQV